MIHNSRQNPEVSVLVSIDFGSGEKSKATLKALIPDNVNLPEGLSVKMFLKNSALCIEMRGKSIPFETVRNTVDEILQHISICQKVMPK